MVYKNLIGLICFLVFSSVAIADVFVEPYAGGGMAYSSMKGSGIGAVGSIFPGFVLGGRLGYELLTVQTGLEVFYNRYSTSSGFSMSSVVINKSSVSKGFSQAGESVSIQYSQLATHFHPVSVGVFGVFDIPFMFDVYGSVFYSFGSRDTRSYHGPGVKAGMSYLSAFFVKFLLEIKWAYYLCRSSGSSKCSQSGFNLADIMLTVNVPLSASLFGWDGQREPSDDNSVLEEVSPPEDLFNDTSSSSSSESTDLL